MSGHRLFYYAILLSSLPVLSGCRQEAPNPQWDIDILGPVLKADLGIDQLLADSLTISDADGKVRVVFESEYDNLETDSIYLIPDTTLVTDLWDSLIFPLTIPPGTAIPVTAFSRTDYLRVAASGTPLRKAIIEKGFIRATFRNIYPTQLLFTYVFPKCIKNGSPITIVDTVAAGSQGVPAFGTTEIDISGTEIDLTGRNGNLFNAIYYTLAVTTDPNGGPITISYLDNVVHLETELKGIEPYYVKGYLGQQTFDIDDTVRIGDGKLLQSGTMQLDSATLSMELENGIGADLSAYISSLTSIRNGTPTVSLVAPSVLNRNVNLGRALETGNPASPVIPTRASFLLDNSNSNLKSFIQNLPDRIGTRLRFSLNPMGNIGGNSDFVFKDRLIKTRTRLEIPLRLSMDALTLLDTQDLSTTNLNDLNVVGPFVFKLIAENGFPVDIQLQLSLLDAGGTVTDQLLVPDIIPAGATDAQWKVIAPTTTRISIPVDGTRKQHLLEATRMIIRASFTSVGQPQLLDLYDSYRLKLKLVADGTYSIR
ncbi:MAG: hypothetical protein RL213_2084 [Bacteroidota bacterium]|jgi:hypothetical protein